MQESKMFKIFFQIALMIGFSYGAASSSSGFDCSQCTPENCANINKQKQCRAHCPHSEACLSVKAHVTSASDAGEAGDLKYARFKSKLLAAHPNLKKYFESQFHEAVSVTELSAPPSPDEIQQLEHVLPLIINEGCHKVIEKLTPHGSDQIDQLNTVKSRAEHIIPTLKNQPTVRDVKERVAQIELNIKTCAKSYGALHEIKGNRYKTRVEAIINDEIRQAFSPQEPFQRFASIAIRHAVNIHSIDVICNVLVQLLNEAPRSTGTAVGSFISKTANVPLYAKLLAIMHAVAHNLKFPPHNKEAIEALIEKNVVVKHQAALRSFSGNYSSYNLALGRFKTLEELTAERISPDSAYTNEINAYHTAIQSITEAFRTNLSIKRRKSPEPTFSPPRSGPPALPARRRSN